MIISASRRTDIPAFYGQWLINRIREGFFLRINPYNRNQQKTISLSPGEVDAFVFWSKNPRPFLKNLDILDSLGYHYVFQFTLNDYPALLEPMMPHLHHRIATFQKLSDKIGKEKVVWRFDPILISNLTPASYHLERFQQLAEILSPWTNRVIISFYDEYWKSDRRMKQLEKEKGLIPQEPSSDEDFLKLLKGMGEVAQKHGLSLFSCAEEMDLEQYGINHGACIDMSWINEIFDLQLPYKKDPNQRKECLCGISIDMGSYDTCPFACQYCYATSSEKTLYNRRKNLDVGRPWL